MTLRVLAVLGCASLALAGCAKEQPNGPDQFKQSFRKSFVESCVAGSTTGPNALPPARAEAKCACMADHLIKTYSAEELGSLSDAPGSAEAAAIMDKAIAACK